MKLQESPFLQKTLREEFTECHLGRCYREEVELREEVKVGFSRGCISRADDPG